MNIKFYPERETMIAVLKAEIPIKIDFDSGDNEKLKKLWDVFQAIKEKHPEVKERNETIVKYVGEVLMRLKDNELKGE